MSNTSSTNHESKLQMLRSKINHIIVVMLENRSFDHMMGYLSLLPFNAETVDGLNLQRDITRFKGKDYPVFLLKDTSFDVDPNHSVGPVKVQMGADETGTKMRGFMKDFATNKEEIAKKKPEMILGYYNESNLKMFHYLYNEFYLSQKWFSCIPGPTSPNRAFAMSGKSKVKGKHRTSNPTKFKDLFDGPNIFEELTKQKVGWRYYYHDFSQVYTFRSFFPYIIIGNENFLKFDVLIDDIKYGAYDGKKGLAQVSWVDPDFGSKGFETRNDDHPTADIRNGQSLLSELLNAFYDEDNGKWREIFKETLIIVYYDEHGGFYDHVYPPNVPPGVDYPLATYGLRVPGFIVSPMVIKNYKEQKTYNHVTAIRTILDIFCKPDEKGSLGLGVNVDKAELLDYNMFDENRDMTTIEPPPKIKHVKNPKQTKDKEKEIDKARTLFKITEFLQKIFRFIKRIFKPKEDDLVKVIDLVSSHTEDTFEALRELDDKIKEKIQGGNEDISKITKQIKENQPKLAEKVNLNEEKVERRVTRLERQRAI